ncbi:MAG: SusC/RagA family TonB-linked outer membrane protein [Mangrovibacterium sp.]
MKKKYLSIFTFLCTVLLFSVVNVMAQQTEKESQITISSVVTDENGNPIEGAVIYGNEGAVTAKTDGLGQFSITVPDNTDVLIEADGYESAFFHSTDKYLGKFTLQSSLFLFGEKDIVNTAFGKVKRGTLINAVSVLEPDNIRQYDNIQKITEALSGRLPGLLGSSNIRGIGSALFIVDGLPRDISTINLSEIDQITVLKDINSSVLYGNAAVNGVVLITTKRGQAYKKQINVSAYSGISKPTALPKYLSSADYMELYNEARVNDGLAPQYSTEAIDNYRSGNPYRYPSVDFYSDEYLKEVKPFSRVSMDLSGGNDVATYYSNVGWFQTGNLLNFGAGKDAKSNTFNARGNVDLRINDRIKSSLDAVAVLSNTKGARGDFWGLASTLRPNLFSPLLPINLIDPDNELLKGRKNDVGGMYLLGGTSSYQSNPIATGYSGGANEHVQRTFSFNNRIDFELDRIAEGLAFHTNISFDYYTEYDQYISNSYAVYTPIWDPEEDLIIGLTQYGTDARTGVQNVGNASYERRIGFYGMLDYNKTINQVHHISGSLLGYATNHKIQGNLQGNKNANLGLRLNYNYDNKYLVDFSSAYVNSAKLPEGNRGAFSPSLGLAWIISSGMSPGSVIDYLKLRASAGLMNTDAGIDGYYYYDNRYGTSGSYAWYEGGRSANGVLPYYGGNSRLSFEKKQEINLGFESILFSRRLSFDANVFKSVYSDQITRPQTQYPGYFLNYIPYENFEKNAHQGAELGISYNQKIDGFTVVIGANALYADSEVKKKDEIYSEDYLYRTGRPVDARFGLVAEGFFMDQADVDNHEIQAFGTVKPGDIKYVDQNGDGIIDSNDEVQIGRWQAPFSYGLNMKLSYKNLTLFAHGTGRIGADGYLTGNYYWVDGDDKYSEIVLNRWTEATKATATFPRLSSAANSNNFHSSTFWLYRDDYFTLDRVQLTYEVPIRTTNKIAMKSLSFYIDASNLLTISKYKDFRELSVGSEPYYRSFSLGLNATF